MHAVHTVYPWHGDGLEQDGDEHGVSGGVTVEQVEEVESSLSTRRETDHEVQEEQKCYEHLAVASDQREFIAHCSYDRLRTAELKWMDHEPDV